MISTMSDRKIRFSLDTASGVPFYRQVIDQIESAILARHLVPGDRLPTIRSLAIELKINPNTIARAYGELEIRGILNTQVGSGTYVADKRIDLEDAERKKKIEAEVARFVRNMVALGVDRQGIIDLVRDFEEV